MANPTKRDWTGIFTACVFVGGLLWVAHNEISKVDEKIANVDKHIGRVETAVRIVGAKQGGDTKTLIDEALTVAKNASDEGRTQSAKTVLDIAKHLLAEQKTSREPAPQEFFDNAAKKYREFSDNAAKKYQASWQSSELKDAAWEGTLELVEYRSAISTVPPGFGVHIGELSQKGNFRYLKDSLIYGEHAIAFGNEQGFVLDGFWLDNVVFENATIIYHSGPVILQNVHFVNCKFELKKSPQSEQLVQAAVRQPVSVTIG